MTIRICAIVLMLLSIQPLCAIQKPKPGPEKKPALTEEEKEIIRNREMLENMDLLQNFEKLRFLDLFAEKTDPKDGGVVKKEHKQDGKKDK